MKPPTIGTYIGGKRLEPGIVHHEKNRTRPSQTVILPTNISIPRNGQLLHFAIRQLDAIGLKKKRDGLSIVSTLNFRTMPK